MRVWLDNTGIQAAALCLDGRGRSSDDVKEFLQLATLIAFSDALLVNGFEVPEVARRTEEIRETLVSLGLRESAFCIQGESKASFVAACAEAAEHAADDLRFGFGPTDVSTEGILPPSIDSATRKRQAALPPGLINAPTEQVLCEVREEALSRKAGGAIQLMLTESERLRRAVAEADWGPKQLSDAHAQQLSSYLRCYLNETLAARYSSKYAPAVARAVLMRRNNQLAIAAIERSLEQVVQELSPEPLGAPPVASYLIQKAHGEPKGVIAEAIRLREKTSELRGWLRRRLEPVEGNYSAYAHEVATGAETLRVLVRQALKPGSEDRLTAGIELHFVLGAPTASLSLDSLRTWMKSHMARRRTAILTEISRAAAYPGDPLAVQRLRANCLAA